MGRAGQEVVKWKDENQNLGAAPGFGGKSDEDSLLVVTSSMMLSLSDCLSLIWCHCFKSFIFLCQSCVNKQRMTQGKPDLLRAIHSAVISVVGHWVKNSIKKES